MCEDFKKSGNTQLYDLNSPAVTTHLSIVAEIINRLANNSNYCKTVCIAIVAAFFSFTKSPGWYCLIVWCLPIGAIALLDSMFVWIKKKLTVEQEAFVSQFLTSDQLEKVRKQNKRFPTKDKGENDDDEMLPFVLCHSSWLSRLKGTLANLGDISIWLFYGTMIIAIALDVLFISIGLIDLVN